MSDLVVALGLVLVIEGVIYALFPAQMKRMVTAVLASEDGSIRTAGLICALLGVGVVWLVRG